MIRVNGELVSSALLDDAFTRIKSEEEIRIQGSCCERNEEFEKAAEEEVIDSILIAQEAEKIHKDLPEEEVTARLEKTIKLYREHGASWEMLEAESVHLREEVKANLRMERFIAENLPPVAELTEEELVDYYQAHEKEYCSLPEVHCYHLIKKVDGQGEPRELLDEMTAIRERLLAGADFGELAREVTEKESGEIDLGWIPLERPTNPFEAVLFSLQEGEISPVISYDRAFHLVQVQSRRGGVTPDLEELRAGLRDRYVAEKRQQAVRKLAGELRGARYCRAR